MRSISLKLIEKKRRLLDKKEKIFRVAEAKDFVERLGIVTVFCDGRLPCLLKAIYTADLLNRFEADQRLWDFVHVLIVEKWIYYGRILGDRNTIISMKLLPSLMHLNSIPDYNNLCDQKSLRQTEETVLETLDAHGPLMTREIRSKLGIASTTARKKLTAAMVDLQRKLLICCAGKIHSRGGWHSDLWATTEKWIPRDVVTRASLISDEEARKRLTEKYIYATTRTTTRAIARFFKWPIGDAVRTVSSLIDKEMVSSYNHKGETYLFKGNL